MEIKINREIRDYKENIFFGLSLRQLIFSLLACGMAVPPDDHETGREHYCGR